MTLTEMILQQPSLAFFGIVLASIWSIVWKGIALWHASKNEQKSWYVVILILNTLGLLPIIYLIWFKPKT